MSERDDDRRAPDLPGYEWVRALGAGGFADVHLYRQQTPSRDVAVKVVRQAHDHRGVDVLQREADAMASVSGHPAVVALHGVGSTADGRPYLVMEYCPVTNVGEQVRRQPMSVATALDLAIQVCGGVEMLHRAGWVHRDIKPSNIMLSAYGRPVLGDFGVARRLGPAEPGAPEGFSVLWAPPEQQIEGAGVHPTQDVWALASTVWTLLTGRSPFEDPVGDNSPVSIAARVRSGRLPGLGRADAPPELEEALGRAMAQDPLARTPGAARLGEELQAVQELMRLPVTRMEVNDQPAVGSAADLTASDPTRLRGIPSVDADRTRLRAYAFAVDDPQAQAPAPDGWSGASASAPESGTGTADAPPSAGERSRVRPWAVALLALVGVAAIAGLAVAMLTGGGAIVQGQGQGQGQGRDATGAAAPADPVGRAPLPAAELVGELRDGTVVWRWVAGEDAAAGAESGAQAVGQAPAGAGPAEPTERFLYTASRPGQEDSSGSTRRNLLEMTAVSGQNCLEVVAQAANGRQSTPTEACVAVP